MNVDLILQRSLKKRTMLGLGVGALGLILAADAPILAAGYYLGKRARKKQKKSVSRLWPSRRAEKRPNYWAGMTNEEKHAHRQQLIQESHARFKAKYNAENPTDYRKKYGKPVPGPKLKKPISRALKGQAGQLDPGHEDMPLMAIGLRGRKKMQKIHKDQKKANRDLWEYGVLLSPMQDRDGGAAT